MTSFWPVAGFRYIEPGANVAGSGRVRPVAAGPGAGVASPRAFPVAGLVFEPVPNVAAGRGDAVPRSGFACSDPALSAPDGASVALPALAALGVADDAGGCPQPLMTRPKATIGTAKRYRAVAIRIDGLRTSLQVTQSSCAIKSRKSSDFSSLIACRCSRFDHGAKGADFDFLGQ